MQPSSKWTAVLGWLLWSHVLMLMAVSPRKGGNDLGIVLFQSGFASLSLIMLLRACYDREQPFLVSQWQPRIGMALVWSGFLFFLFGNTGYGVNRELVMPWRLACLPLLAVYFLPHDPPVKSLIRFVYRWRRGVFAVLCVAAVVLRIVAMFVSPNPEIDVFWFTNQGAASILDGINPYDRSYTVIDPKSEFLYAYLPGQFLIDTPAVVLLGNMRWGQILLELLAAVLTYRLVMGKGSGSRRQHSAELATLLLLYFPQVLRMQEQSWVEFKQVFGMALFVYLLTRWPERARPWLALGFLFSLKQTTWAAWPFLQRLKPFGIRPALITGAVMAILIVPFILWNPYAFYDDIVLYHVGLGIPGSTSLSRAYVLATGTEPPLWWVAVAGGAVLLYLWRFGEKSLLGFLLAASALGMLPVLLRQAFLNYYYYIDATLLIALAWMLRRQHDRDEGIAEVAL